ncbi:MAG: BrnA antitoxin family protein [Deltaproteobacteria bacterium]
MSKLKKIPKFKNKEEELEFWSSHDSTDYVDFSKAKKALFPNLKPSTKTISVRLPESLIEHLKQLANKRDVPYQSLLKMFLAERVKQELHAA